MIHKYESNDGIWNSDLLRAQQNNKSIERNGIWNYKPIDIQSERKRTSIYHVVSTQALYSGTEWRDSYEMSTCFTFIYWTVNTDLEMVRIHDTYTYQHTNNYIDFLWARNNTSHTHSPTLVLCVFICVIRSLYTSREHMPNMYTGAQNHINSHIQRGHLICRCVRKRKESELSYEWE